jgi:hypothetical protein
VNYRWCGGQERRVEGRRGEDECDEGIIASVLFVPSLLSPSKWGGVG